MLLGLLRALGVAPARPVRCRRDPAALVHGNRGRASPRRVPDEAIRAAGPGPRPGPRTTGPTTATWPSCSPSARASRLSRVTVRRILRAAGHRQPEAPATTPAPQPAATGCPRRACSLQVDGSRPRLARGPRAAADPGRRDRRCDRRHRGRHLPRPGGRRRLLRAAPAHRIRATACRWRSTATVPAPSRSPRASRRRPSCGSPTPGRQTQVGRALAELGHPLDRRPSAQAKGRIERGCGAPSRTAWSPSSGWPGRTAGRRPTRVLARYVARLNRRFAVEPADPQPAWRPSARRVRPGGGPLLPLSPGGGRRRHRPGGRPAP